MNEDITQYLKFEDLTLTIFDKTYKLDNSFKTMLLVTKYQRDIAELSKDTSNLDNVIEMSTKIDKMMELIYGKEQYDEIKSYNFPVDKFNNLVAITVAKINKNDISASTVIGLTNSDNKDTSESTDVEKKSE